MSAGERVDLRKLAQAGQTVNGELDLAFCDRLADQLAQTTGRIAYRITGGQDMHGWPTATIALSGVVPLVCQRCLQAFDYPLETATTVRLARSERELAAWDEEEIEAVLADQPLDTQDLIEEELVLGLPYAPMHPSGACPGRAEESREPGPEADSGPFGALAGLIKR
jgi:uncharacterized protein